MKSNDTTVIRVPNALLEDINKMIKDHREQARKEKVSNREFIKRSLQGGIYLVKECGTPDKPIYAVDTTADVPDVYSRVRFYEKETTIVVAIGEHIVSTAAHVIAGKTYITRSVYKRK